jgi:DNA-directed RNA polymerase subunit RPC12/RpoP
MNTKCATCEAPLYNSGPLSNIGNPELYCTQNREADHLPVACIECGKKFPDLQELRNHANAMFVDSIHKYCVYHYSFCCAILECSAKIRPYDIHDHFRRRHPEVQYPCAQCGVGYSSLSELDQHGDDTMHAAYLCRYPECGSECTRIAELHRHQLIHKSKAPRHACPHCRK